MPQGWTVVPEAAKPASEPSGWTPVAAPAAAPAQATPDIDPTSYAHIFGRAALGSLANSVDPHVAETIGNGVLGILKGAGHTAETLGKLVHKIPGVTAAVDAMTGTGGNSMSQAAFGAADEDLKPQGTAQKVGYGAEQAAEFMVPGGAAERGAATIAAKAAPVFQNAPRLVQAAAKIAPRMLTEGAAAGGTAIAQGNDPAMAAALGAAGPAIGGVVKAAAPALREQAETQVMQALGPTKERYKAMAEKLVPQILKRGIRGSREGIMAQAADAAETAGQQIDDALQQFGSRTTGTQPITDAIEKAKDTFRVTNQAGKVVDVEPRAIKQLSKLQDTIGALGPDASVSQLVAVRRAWDTVVAQAGGFAHRAPGGIGTPLKDTTEAWAKREGAGAIRKLLDTTAPELTTLNKEFSFWKNLDDVLTQTTQRTGPHGEGLTATAKEAAGQVAGAAMHGGVTGAFALGKVAKLANSVFTSPRWKLASAQMKDKLAEAIAANDLSGITTTLGRISAGVGTQATSAGTQ